MISTARTGLVMKKQMYEISNQVKENLSRSNINEVSLDHKTAKIQLEKLSEKIIEERESNPLLVDLVDESVQVSDRAEEQHREPTQVEMQEVVIVMTESLDDIEKARPKCQDQKTRFDRTRMTLEESKHHQLQNDVLHTAVRVSFAEAQIIDFDEQKSVELNEEHQMQVDDVQTIPTDILAASKLDAMYTFLKINFTSLWGSDPASEHQFEAKIFKIKMQLERIDETGLTKFDYSELRTEIERLQQTHNNDELIDDFNPALLVDNVHLNQVQHDRKKSKSSHRKKKSARVA